MSSFDPVPRKLAREELGPIRLSSYGAWDPIYIWSTTASNSTWSEYCFKSPVYCIARVICNLSSLSSYSWREKVVNYGHCT
eukprot:scaffold320168_cov55-Attheya_sp.AAC.2